MFPVGRLHLVHCISRRLLSSSSSACRPHPVVVNPKTLNSLFHEPNLDLFLTRLHRLSATSQLPTSIYAVAARRLASAGRSAEAANLLDSLKESLSPELPSNESLSASLISLYSKAGLPDRALEAFHHLLPSLGAPRTVRSFNALLSALSEHDPDRAVREFESIPLADPEIKPDVASYSMLVRALCEKGDLDGAAACLHVMEEKGVEPNEVTYNTLLNALYKSDRVEEAEGIWGKMEEKGCGPNIRSYNAKLRWLVTKGRTVEAADLLRWMILQSSNSKSTGGVMPDGYSFTALIVAYCKDGNLKEGKRMLDELRRNKCEPTPWTYEALVPQMCEEGELDSALSLCHESLRKRCRVGVQVLQGVVDRLVTASRVGDARKLVETAWSRHYYSKESLIMPPECLALIESEEQEKMLKETKGQDESLKGNLVLRKVSTDEGEGLQDKSVSSGASCKIGIIVKSFDKPKYMGAFGVPPDKNRVKLPTTRTLITVLRSPHVHKKSREQFDMKVRREYIVIKCQPHELNKKYFWFKRARVLGAQFELVFSYRTRLDMSRLKQSV